ncbi:TPA: hypothetical protein RXG61_004935 [Escherichia coli]|nr:hypothetical protein [Escherichia coli]HEA6318418.1 hypothetical protein [Escherichia coli]HEA6337628.1 hypothetical protein [Escherichia coli]
MAKLGENTPHIIDATVDFMASSQAFREYLKKLPPDNTIPPDLTDEHVPLYIGLRLGNEQYCTVALSRLGVLPCYTAFSGALALIG